MRIPFRFSLIPFVMFLLIFGVEVVIALFFDDEFIRPLVGDVLVVVLLFYLVKSFIDWPDINVAIGVCVFAWCVEFAQAFQLVDVLGLGDVPLARTVIGTTFDWRDLVAYTVGAVLSVWLERWRATVV